MASYFASLNFEALLRACPGGIAQGLIWGIMALGVYFTFRILDLADLSVDGSFATGGAVSIMLILNGWNPELTLIIAFIAGLLAGAVTGFLHTKLGIPAILAGILTQIALYSINLNIMGKANQAINVGQTSLRITSNVDLIWRTILIMFIGVIILMCLLYRFLGIEIGCAFRATGNNDVMSRSLGINTDHMKLLGLALSNGLVAMSGGLLAQYQGFADVNMGRGAIVIGLAAVVIGEVICEAIYHRQVSYFHRLSFIVIGSIVYYLVYVLVLWLKFPANDMKLLTAVVVAIFLAVPYLKNKRTNSFRYAGNMAKKMENGGEE